jgi:hypothetical protein
LQEADRLTDGLIDDRLIEHFVEEGLFAKPMSRFEQPSIVATVHNHTLPKKQELPWSRKLTRNSNRLALTVAARAHRA